MKILFTLTIGIILFNSLAFANNKSGCNFAEKDRCRDCDAIVKLSCGAIEGNVLNSTIIESLDLVLKNEKTQTQRLITVDNIGAIADFSFRFGPERLLKEREIEVKIGETVSLAENGINISGTTKIYGTIFGANFNNEPLTNVSEALSTNPAMECDYINRPFVVLDLSREMKTSCYGEVQCRNGSSGSNSPATQVSCHATGSRGYETCPTAIECATSRDTLLIREVR